MVMVKHDLDTGRSWSLPFGPGRYGSEAPFAPRQWSESPHAEDAGYLISFITDPEREPLGVCGDRCAGHRSRPSLSHSAAASDLERHSCDLGAGRCAAAH
jgi:hypothetical protein